MLKLFKRRTPKKVLYQCIEEMQGTVLGLCSELRQNAELTEKIAGLFMPAERDLLQHKKEDAIYAPGFGPRVYFTRESLVSEHGFTQTEADTLVDLVHEMAERREELA